MNSPQSRPPISLLRAFGAYCACLFLFYFVLALLGYFAISHIYLALVNYLVLGIFLNVTVLRRLVQWHPMYNTLNHVVKAKFMSIVGWVIVYPVLFISFAIVRYL